VRTLEEIGLPELSPEQKENLCVRAEKAAREYIAAKVPLRKISTLNVIIEIEGEKPVTVTIDIEISLPPQTKNHDPEQLAKEATKKAQEAAEAYLREIACKSSK
jgi:GGDEF domain-containing protein